MKFRKAVITLLVCTIVSLTAGEAGAESGKTSLHPGNEWSRQSAYPSPAKPKIKWSVDLGKDVSNMVIDSEGVIYVVSKYNFSRMLAAVSPEGKVKWRVELQGDSNGLMLYQDNTIILSTYDNDGSKINSTISAYATDGTLIWENKYSDFNSFSRDAYVSPDGLIVLTGSRTQSVQNKEEARIVGITAEGEPAFDVTTQLNYEYISVSSPIIAENTIYFTASKGIKRQISKRTSVIDFNDGKLIRMDKAGKIIGSTAYKGEYNFTPPVYTNKTLYVQTNEALHLFDSGGKVIRKISAPAKAQSNNGVGPTIGANGTYIFGQRVYDAKGKMVWSLSPFDVPFSEDYSVNTVLMDKNQNALLIYGTGVKSVNPKTKKTNWKLPLYQNIASPPVLGKDGTLYVGGTTKLFAIK